MSINRKLVIIVDAYGPARYFQQYLKQQGYLCVHLLGTSQPLPRLNLFDLEQYDATLVHTGDFNITVGNINTLVASLDAELCEILPGVEPGVLLADKLSYHFGLHNNGIEKSRARRDKSEMADVLSVANIPIPHYCRTDTLNEALNFARRYDWPVVLKPLDSAGTNGVHFCYSEKEVINAFHQVMGVENNMGFINQEVLLQTFLSGKEFMVNTVSRDGQHYVSDIWYTDKIHIKGYSRIYNKNYLVDSRSEEYALLKEYVFRVLDTLDIKYGPAHSEVIITPEGPMLVEIASRISGAVDPQFNQACLGNDQIALTLESYLEPEKFLQRIGLPYQVKKLGLQIFLISKKAGKITLFDFPQHLRYIPSVVNFKLKPNVGDILVKTFDLSSSPGIVHLVADNEKTLLQDYQHIQTLFDQYVRVDTID
ncbi:ATP-grasp domain-containing protein [Photorhabdus africana]|uniref:ATP-grasp domain-containing protein n=1 Tax=Photorhabdus africana TaxID=3097554 RepID=UPI002B41371E|nr:ATP-grasp domain-containing protein [Photorhabdus sp. CRI-LC]